MDRILQPIASVAHPHSGAPAPAHARAVITPHVVSGAHPTLPPKSASDFLRALKRRIWLVLIVAILVGGAGTFWVVRQQDVFRATAQILIEPPRFDAAVAGLLPTGSNGHIDEKTSATFVPNKIAFLHSKAFADLLVQDATIEHLIPVSVEPAQEIADTITPRQLPGTTIFDVSYESTDPDRASGLLNAALKEFARLVEQDNRASIEYAQNFVKSSVAKLKKELSALDDEIQKTLQTSPIFAPNGKNLLEEELIQTKIVLHQKRYSFEELSKQHRLAQSFPHLNRQPTSTLDVTISELRKERKHYTEMLAKLKASMSSTARFNNDPSSRHFAQQLERTMDDLDELEKQRNELMSQDVTGAAVTMAGDEIRKLELKAKSLMETMQGTMPAFQIYLTKIKERDQQADAVNVLKGRLSEFELLAQTLKKPVIVQRSALVPAAPVRPKRVLMIAVFSCLGLALGVGLVCMLEYIDQSVKVPEHLTAGLGLPILGVVPRMRRLARLHRGGHLWTPGCPLSIEADAYRNLRASLVTIPGRHGAATTFLVTSAKAGEGKSTTALNLAATCARAGERTLLIDCDLRRPSLRDVFVESDRDAPNLGLVDVLQGDSPWQRTVVRTDVPNLDFLPTGDPTGIPIEVLGSLELRQLVTAVAGHYHKVIIDGPAVLGMADCRMLGRLVDAAVMVVRSGAHELRPLLRARGMLEQSRVPIAGLVFNGITDDLRNWSSYGSAYDYPIVESVEYDPAWSERDSGFASEEPVAVAAGQLSD
jgi:polysaccharide biosynthesis transport protein